MKNYYSLLFIIFNLILASCTRNNTINKTDYDYNTAQKKASDFTKAKQDTLKAYLDFENTKDFVNATKGKMDSITPLIIIQDESLDTIYDLSVYDFLKTTDSIPYEANPSLWRQSQLNYENGLFEVVAEKIYQIRGFDLANMTLVKGDDGWIVIDPLGSPETSKKGLELANKTLSKAGIISNDFPVSTVIFTHSHIDHFGGIWGVIDKDDHPDVEIYAPKGFFEEAISENVMAGNAMGRRASYMYGNILTKDATGTLGSGLGQATSTGMAGIIDATDFIDENTTEAIEIDGHSIEFLYTPGAEAPAEMIFYFPDLNAFCQAEEINHTMHNLYTLRGAKVRNGQKWSQYIDEAIQKWGDSVEVSFGSHHWPTWNEGGKGKNEITTLWENQRDMFRFIHDQTLRLANNGYTPIEIAEMLKLPTKLDTEFANRGYYGSLSHNIRAQYQLYFGWFDGNPANLNKLTPTDNGKSYVKYIGGETLLAGAKNAFDNGEYRWAAEVLNQLIFAEEDPKNPSLYYNNARYLLADSYEQLGYQAESGPWRNFYLSGAKELRSDESPYFTNQGKGTQTASPDMTSGMTNELLFNYISMTFDGVKNDSLENTFQIIFKDDEVKDDETIIILIIQNGVVTPRIGVAEQDISNVTETINMTRADFDSLIIGNSNGIEISINNSDGDVSFNNSKFKEFLNMLDTFGEKEFWFDIVKPDSD